MVPRSAVNHNLPKRRIPNMNTRIRHINIINNFSLRAQPFLMHQSMSSFAHSDVRLPIPFGTFLSKLNQSAEDFRYLRVSNILYFVSIMP